MGTSKRIQQEKGEMILPQRTQIYAEGKLEALSAADGGQVELEKQFTAEGQRRGKRKDEG